MKVECYPFKQFKVSKLRETTIKRSLTKADIERVIAYKTTDEYVRFSINLFYFSYLSWSPFTPHMYKEECDA